MKNKTKIFVMLGIAVVLIAAGVLTLVFWPKEDIKELYTEAVKESLGIGNSESKEEEKNIYDGKIVKADFEYNDLSGETPKNNKIELIGDDTKENSVTYLLASIFLEDIGKNEQYEIFIDESDKSYLYIKDVFSKYYYLENSEVDEENEDIPKLDFEMILKALGESFFDVVDGDNIKKADKELTIDGKKYESTKYSYTFTGSDLYSVFDNTFKKIKKEDIKQYDFLVQYFNLKDFESLKDAGNLFTYTVYLDGDKVISSSLTSHADEDLEQNITITKDSLDGYFRFYISSGDSTDDSTVFDFVVKTESDKKATLSLSVMGMKMITGEFTKESENSISFNIKNTKQCPYNIDIQGDVTLENNKEDGTISITAIIGEDFKYEINYSSKNDGLEGECSFIYSVEDKVVNEIKFAVEVLDKMPEFDFSNSAPLQEMTQEEAEYFMNRFSFMFSLIQNISSPNYD